MPRLNDLLEKLGETSMEVRDTLMNMNIKGERGARGDCPVARYLREQYPDCAVEVGHRDAKIYCGDGEERALLPFAVGMFVQRFDHEDFPELVDEDGR